MDQYPRQYLYRRIVRAKLFIDEHYGRSIDLSDIAVEACFSKYHFARMFREVYRRTPHQYLIDVRIRAARRMLTCGAAVKEVCYAVGFDSVPSFSSLFRRQTGETPAAFRTRMARRQAETIDTPAKFVPNCFVEPVRTAKRNFR